MNEGASNQGHGAHGPIVTFELTWHGVPKVSKTTHDVIQEGQRIFKEERSRIKQRKGRWGPSFDFGAFRKTKNSIAPVSHKHWGYTMDRWTSLEPNKYLVALHLILEDEAHQTATDCDHAQHGTAEHVCNAFRILDVSEAIPPEKQKVRRRSPSRPSIRKTVADPADDSVKITPATAADSPTVAEPNAAAGTDDSENEGDAPQTTWAPRPWEPARPGSLSSDIENVFRHLPSMRNLASPSVVHARHHPDGTVDVFVATDIKGDDAYRMFDLRLRQGGGAPLKKQPLAAAKYVNLETLATLFQKEGMDGIACTDAIQRLGPWKREEFKRDIPDFDQWQDAFHECFRADKLKGQLRRRKLRLVKLVDPEHRVIQNEYGEVMWTVEAID